MKEKIITLILVAFTTITNAQNYFKAKVLDSESNEALIGATLLLKNTNNGVSTDINGLATLNNIPNGEQTIVITFIGYKDEHLSFTFPIKEGKIHTILLSPSDAEMQKRRNVEIYKCRTPAPALAPAPATM